MPTARTIITLALESMNRLSPGETPPFGIAGKYQLVSSIITVLYQGRWILIRQNWKEIVMLLQNRQ